MSVNENCACFSMWKKRKWNLFYDCFKDLDSNICDKKMLAQVLKVQKYKISSRPDATSCYPSDSCLKMPSKASESKANN